MGRSDVISLWFGEPDVATPDFIRQAAIDSLNQGETFYTEGLGRMFLREALSSYLRKLHSAGPSPERIAVTVSGGNAINLAFQCVLREGDQVVTPTPAFPNLQSIPALQGAQVQTVPMHYGPQIGWQLDINRLVEACATARAVLVNSPSNPTGWVQSRDDQLALLAASRRYGTWIISDEVYSRIYFDGPVAPSWVEIAEPEDRVLIVNSFSKAWAMTGWRLGWLTAPTSLMPTLERIIEFSISSAPAFTQRAATQALTDGEPFIAESVARYRHNLDTIEEVFAGVPQIRFLRPPATFYAFFEVEGVRDNLDYAARMMNEAGVGLAPGTTFDPHAHSWFRLCFAQSPARLQSALQRLQDFWQAE